MHRGHRRATSSVILTVALAASSITRAQNSTFVVSDFDGEKIESRAGLSLVVWADEQFGGTSEARLALIQPGADKSRGALRISFRVTDEFPNPFVGAWAMVGRDALATDLTAYRGVRFSARSKDATAFTAGVVRFPGQVTRYMMPFEVRPEWTVVELPFDKFQELTMRGTPAAKGSPLVPKDVTAVGINVASGQRGQFEIDVDRIELYR